MRQTHIAILLAATGLFALPARAIEIDGVGNGAIDQPKVNVILRPQPVAGVASTEDALETDISGLEDLLPGLDLGDLGITPNNIEAFYDTGAGVGLFGGQTASNFAIPTQAGATFADIGVGGLESFGISDRLTIEIGSNAPGFDPTNLANYNHKFVDAFAAIGDDPTGIDSGSTDPFDQIIDDLISAQSDFNVLGMPYFENKIVVMDARSLNAFARGEGGDLLDLANLPQLFTHVYDASDPSLPAFNPANTNNPGVPTGNQIHYTIEMDFADFSGLTSTTGGTPPSLAHNPMIGALPPQFNETVDGSDDVAGVTISLDGESSTGTWLFDTGAAATIISTAQAGALGIQYRAGFEPSVTDDVQLENSDDNSLVTDQFTLQLSGVGGTITVAGFFLDALTMQAFTDYDGTKTPEDLAFLNAPVLVADISVDDPANPGEQYTLDGIFGMNFLFATTFLDGPIDLSGGAGLPLIPGAFDFVVYDETTNLVHLIVVPEPTTVAFIVMGGGLMMLRKRKAGLTR